MRVILLMLLVLISVNGFSQEDTTFIDMDLEELLNVDVSIVCGVAQKESKTPAIVTVITKSDIVKYGATTLTELMSFVPGFSVKDSYWKRQLITSRGISMNVYNDKMLLLVNGVPMYDPVTMEYYLDIIPLSAVKKIEIIRGPGSTMYGTNAYAAVINIVTEGYNSLQPVTAFSEIGNYGELQAGMSVGDKTKYGLEYYIASSLRNDEGYIKKDVVDENGVKRDLRYEFDNAALYTKIKYKDVYLESGYLSQEWTNFGFVPIHIYNNYEGGRVKVKEMFTNLHYNKKINDNFNIKYYLHFLDYRNDGYIGDFRAFVYQELFHYIDSSLFDNPQQFFLTWEGWKTVSEIKLNYNFSKLFNLQYSVRADYLNRKDVNLNSDAVDTSLYSLVNTEMPSTSYIYSTALLVNGEFFGKLGYLAGVRYSYYQDNKAFNFSPRLGLVYSFNENTTVKLLYGQAYRQPSFIETYYNIPLVVYGASVFDTVLAPEKLNSYEIAINKSFSDKIKLGINGFYFDANDLIGVRNANAEENAYLASMGLPTGMVYFNKGPRKILGGEIDFVYKVGDFLELWGNAAYKDGKVYNNEDSVIFDYLPYIEKYTFNAGLSLSLLDGDLVIAPNLQYVGDRKGPVYNKDDSFKGENIVPAYLLGNISVAYNLSSHLVLNLLVKNVGDVEYYYPEDIRNYLDKIPGGPGRMFFVRLIYK